MSPLAVADEMSAAIRIRGSTHNRQSAIRTGDLVVDFETRTVSVHEKPVRLTGKEYSIVELLGLRKGSTVTKKMRAPLRRTGQAGAQDHRCFCLQSAQKARPGNRRQSLHRNGVGPRLYASRPGSKRGHPDTSAIMPEARFATTRIETGRCTP